MQVGSPLSENGRGRGAEGRCSGTRSLRLGRPSLGDAPTPMLQVWPPGLPGCNSWLSEHFPWWPRSVRRGSSTQNT